LPADPGRAGLSLGFNPGWLKDAMGSNSLATDLTVWKSDDDNDHPTLFSQ